MRRPLAADSDDSQFVPRLAPEIVGVFDRPAMQLSEIREAVTCDRAVHEHERILSSGPHGSHPVRVDLDLDEHVGVDEV